MNLTRTHGGTAKTRRVCVVSECGGPVKGHGYCNKHYCRFRKHGTPHKNKWEEDTPAQAFFRQASDFSGNECLEWPFSTYSNGYARVHVRGKMHIASRLMCVEAHGEPPTKDHQAAHSCGNKGCINPKHLRWATPRENIADKRIHGTENFGERNGVSKLTVDAVRAIRKARGKCDDVGKKFNVSGSTVSLIRLRKSWAHVE